VLVMTPNGPMMWMPAGMAAAPQPGTPNGGAATAQPPRAALWPPGAAHAAWLPQQQHQLHPLALLSPPAGALELHQHPHDAQQAASQPIISEITPAEEAGGGAHGSRPASGLLAAWPASLAGAASGVAVATVSTLLLLLGLGMAAAGWLGGVARRQARLAAGSARRIAGVADVPPHRDLLLTRPPAGNPTLLLASTLPDYTHRPLLAGEQQPLLLTGPAAASGPDAPGGAARAPADGQEGEEPLLDVADSLAHVAGLWMGLTWHVARAAVALPWTAARIWLGASCDAWQACCRAAAASGATLGRWLLVVVRSSLHQLADSHILLPNVLLLPAVSLLWRGASGGAAGVGWLLARLPAVDEQLQQQQQQQGAATQQLSLAGKQAPSSHASRRLIFDAAPSGDQQQQQQPAAQPDAPPAARAAALVRGALAPLLFRLASSEQRLGVLCAQLAQQDPRDLQLVPVLQLSLAAGRQLAALTRVALAAVVGVAEAGAQWLAAQVAEVIGAPAVVTDMVNAYVVRDPAPQRAAETLLHSACVAAWLLLPATCSQPA
jgi:hypothetical protein